MPKIKSDNYNNMQLIRPMVYVREKDIITYTKFFNIGAMNCGCKVVAQKNSTKRKEVKELIKELKKENKEIEKSLFSASKNVNLDTIIGYKKDGIKHSFLDNYDID
ncbi:MAG: hypothetical protein ACK5HS_01205 [Mycoplasmatales bacterium]